MIVLILIYIDKWWLVNMVDSIAFVKYQTGKDGQFANSNKLIYKKSWAFLGITNRTHITICPKNQVFFDIFKNIANFFKYLICK